MHKESKAVIFGSGTFAEIVNFYLENDSKYNVEAFCATAPEQSSFCDKPLIEIEKSCSPLVYEMFEFVVKTPDNFNEYYAQIFRLQKASFVLCLTRCFFSIIAKRILVIYVTLLRLPPLELDYNG